jgi:bacteriorhodopsin
LKIKIHNRGMSTTETVIEIIVFIAMIVTSIFYIISSKPWFSIIPAITAVAHLNMIYDKEKIELYRYADWAITTPLMLLALLSQNNITKEYIHIVLFLSITMIACNFFGINETDKIKKLIWFSVGTLIFLPIAYVLYNLPIERAAAWFLLGALCVYQIVWLLRANRTIREEPTNIIYSITDAITKVGLLKMLHI